MGEHWKKLEDTLFEHAGNDTGVREAFDRLRRTDVTVEAVTAMQSLLVAVLGFKKRDMRKSLTDWIQQNII
jgi:hypothetical protein